MDKKKYLKCKEYSIKLLDKKGLPLETLSFGTLENPCIQNTHNDLYDSKLNLLENKRIIKEYIDSLIFDLQEQALQDKIGLEKQEIEKQKELENERIKTETEYQKELENIKTTLKTPNIDKITFEIEEFIKLTLNEKTERNALVIAGRSGIGKCIHLNKRSDFILSNDGKMLHIKDIPKNIQSLNLNTLRLETNSVRGITKRKVKKIARIITKTGKKIEPTLEHPFLTINGWKPINKLKEGDYIATPRIYNLNLKKKIDDYKVKILAYLLAEGGLTQTNILFSNKNEIIISELKNAINKFDNRLDLNKLRWGGGDYIISKKRIKTKTKSTGKCIDCKKITFGIKYGAIRCRECYQKFRKNSLKKYLKALRLMGKNSGTKFIPNEIMGLSNKQIALFLNRFFGCDGWAYKSEIAITLKSEIMIRQIQHLLLRFGIISIIKQTYKCATNTKEKKKYLYWRLYITDNRSKRIFKEQIGFFLKEKQKKIEIKERINTNMDIIPINPRKKYKKVPLELRISKKGQTVSRITLNKFADYYNDKKYKILANSDIFWDKIEKIKILKGNFTVWDIEVNNSHNFVCNDFIAHNTFLIKKVLRKLFNSEQLSNMIINGHITSLAYFNLLYDNSNGIFYFDDIEGLHNSETGIALLKQTTETEKNRLVCYNSTTEKLEHRNNSFIFKGMQIFCMNDYPKNDAFLPIISRVKPIEFNPTYKEILLIMYEIIKYKWKDIDLNEKIKVVEFIERNTNEAVDNFDLRLLNNMMDLYIYCNGINDKFINMSRKLIDTNEYKEVILKLMKETMSEKEKVRMFNELTGKKRSYYFYLKKKLVQ